jgi:hypothetical protein
MSLNKTQLMALNPATLSPAQKLAARSRYNQLAVRKSGNP